MKLKINAEHVAKLREDLIDGDAEGLFTEADIQRIKTDDYYCQRFLEQQDNSVEAAVKMAKEALKWRKEFEVAKINEETFPKEFMENTNMYPHGRDKDGCSALIFHIRKHKKVAELALLLKKYVVYWLEKLEKEDDGKQITVIFDCIGAGLSNMDMDIMRFIVDSFKHYYPAFLNNILVIEIPWVLNAAWKIIKLWLPPKSISKVKFLNRKSVLEFMDPSQLLECMGGEDKFEYKYVASNEDVKQSQ